MFRSCRYVLLKYISLSGGCGRYGCYIGRREIGPIVPSFSSKNLSAEMHFRYLITDVASTEVFVDVHLTKERKKGG